MDLRFYFMLIAHHIAPTISGLCDQFLRHITGFNTDTLNKTWDSLPSPKDVQALDEALLYVYINQKVKSSALTHMDFLISINLQDVQLCHKVTRTLDKLICLISGVSIYTILFEFQSPILPAHMDNMLST
ncbi:unnamed protein product [Allacma fusca]|uniref:Uncharacterized protein n=1 Tax=Allacma fusca TaxID=39272 RepID=A0A8J2PDP3_9HEXA|nr:unnamed protein product [Allacma fusca]